jgi:hypothetical protein
MAGARGRVATIDTAEMAGGSNGIGSMNCGVGAENAATDGFMQQAFAIHSLIK